MLNSTPANRKNQGKGNEGAYVSVDTLLKLRHVAKDISLETNKKSIALTDGDSRTSFRGRGMEFAEVRPYQAGDDIRNIDWRVTARTQKPYTKLFQEERERPVYLMVDQRSPMFFGSIKQFKSVYAAKLAAVIAWAALQNNDRIGALIFSDDDQTDSRARRGKHAALAVVNQLYEYNRQLNSPVPRQKSTSLEDMINDMRRVAKPGSSVFLISDFHDFSHRCEEPLSVLSRHCDITVMQVYDELEKALPANRFLSLSNGENKINIAGQSKQFSESFSQSFEQNRYELRRACHQAGINFSSFSAAQSLEGLVQDLFCSRRVGRRK